LEAGLTEAFRLGVSKPQYISEIFQKSSFEEMAKTGRGTDLEKKL